MVNATPRPLYSLERDPVSILQEAGWTPGPVWTSTENVATTGIRSLGRPARSESLCRLRYPSPHKLCNKNVIKYNIFKAIPIQAWAGPYSSRRLRLPEFLDNRHMKVATSSAHHPGNTPGTHFCYEAVSTPGP